MYVNLLLLPQEELVQLSASDVGASKLDKDQILRIMSAQGLFFSYAYALKNPNNGRRLPPHALLFNGQHTDVYFRHDHLMQNSCLSVILANQLLMILPLGKEVVALSPRQRREYKPSVWIVGAGDDSAFLVSYIASQLGSWQAFTHQVAGCGSHECQAMPISSCARVQLVTNAILKTNDLLLAKKAILELIKPLDDIIIQPEVGVVINMSGITRISGMKILSLMDFQPKMWWRGECPLCQEGSKALSVDCDWEQLSGSCWWKPPDD